MNINYFIKCIHFPTKLGISNNLNINFKRNVSISSLPGMIEHK